MSVYKPKNSPHWHFDFVFKGKRFYGSTGCSTERKAKAFEQREREKATLPQRTRPPISLDEACGRYADHAEKLSSWKTIDYMLAALIKGLGGNRLLSEISMADLRTYLAKRRAVKDGKIRSNATINREIENARSVWRMADADKFDVGEMPEWGKLRLKVPDRAPRELRQDEEGELFDACREDLLPAVQFMFLSGWRRAEVIGLRWKDCDLHSGEAQTKIKGGDIVKRPLTGPLITIIANQPKIGPFVFTYVCAKNKSRYVDKLGRVQPARKAGERYPMTATVLRQARAAWKEAGVEDFRIHDLRHTRGTRIVRATGSLAAAKEALKHSSVKTTLRYAHVLADDVRNALNASNGASGSRNSPEQASGPTLKAAGNSEK